eukprot:NODE_12614_length_1213_cov_11.566298.p1 GENE.NODE_12614_length_1213_cov_11.566298~~NODE_12614_length_1213_cov_11.566298.p1  ORF type:complete len:248 (-),score=76.77 NODE_12614_length_1213_cov_11.566298:375-1118(-)
MVDNTMLELKHHVINGRLDQARQLLATTRLSLEDCADEDYNTALHWAVQGLQVETTKRPASDEEVLAYLLQSGAPRNRQNSLGETPLLSAVRLATLEPARAEVLIARLLSAAHADPRRADLTGETPLMEAAFAGLKNMVRLLLEAHADPLAKSSSGLTAKQLAEESDEAEIVQLLLSPLAERATRESRAAAERGEGEEAAAVEAARERQAKRKEQTLFGQKLTPGMANDRDKPGKPYPEYGTLYDID